MTFSEDLRARLRELFSGELAEHAASMSQRLATLEEAEGSQPDNDTLRELFRSAHSLKGAAVAAGYPTLESLCHALETALARWRDHPGPAQPAFLAALRHGVDALEEARVRLGAAQPLDDTALEEVGRRVTEAAAAPGPAPAADLFPVGPMRSAADLPGPAPAAMVLRLPAGQLDGLLDQAGEVLVASQTAGLATELLDSVVDTLATERHRWGRRRIELEAGMRAGRAEAGLVALEETDRAWIHTTEQLRSVADAVRSGQRTLRRAAASFREEARRAGMLPFEVACQGLDAVVREVMRATGRRARLVMGGLEVHLDRLVMSALREPLIHLVRNSVDHGIEPPEEREKAGKPVVGTVAVSAELHGSGVRVVVSDDGAGIDEERIRAAATALGLAPDTELTELLFTPGLSTKAAVTLVSGRGVGLDVVRSRAEALGGSVLVMSVPGDGTKVELLVPSSAATVRVLVARVAGHRVALPLATARRALTVTEHDLRAVENGAVITVSGRTIPVVDLAALLPLPAESTRLSPMAVVIEAGDESAALLVDAVVAEEELVVRPVGVRLAGNPLLLGMAVLPDGDPVTVLNPAACARHGRGGQPLGRRTEHVPVRPRRILLVEDSVTTRALERGILEAGGYEVTTAADGVVGWRLLNQEDVDLVLADVSMPNMDGLELCRRIRASGRFSHLPVILVTTLASDEDRIRGLEAGADAYVVKASFNQGALLETIARLL